MSPSVQRKEYALYSNMLYPTCLRILADAAEAEEAMHDTLLYYFSYQGTFGSEAQKKSWLYKVAASKSIDRLRKKHASLLILEEEAPSCHPDDNPYNQTEQDLTREIARVKQGLARLAPGYRTVLSLYLFEGYDFEEISSILSLTSSAVRSQYVRGLARLREILANHTTANH